MAVQVNLRVPDNLHRNLCEYCRQTGATKTGAIIMLLKQLPDIEEQKIIVTGRIVDIETADTAAAIAEDLSR